MFSHNKKSLSYHKCCQKKKVTINGGKKIINSLDENHEIATRLNINELHMSHY
jgi:hypothetical protein